MRIDKIPDSKYETQLEEKFLIALRHHIFGLRAKAEHDFSENSFKHELNQLVIDPIYPKFALDSEEYVLIRLMGRMSISIGRRLGEIYDKIPRFLASARFDLTPEEVAFSLNELELDIGLKFSDLKNEDSDYVRGVIRKYLPECEADTGLGIEIRYNFNPNDSARLRKDEAMVDYLQKDGLLPVYLIFSAISPRDDAIARLEKAGWNFLIGDTAISFGKNLLGPDLAKILDQPNIKSEVKNEINDIMKIIFSSYAFGVITEKYKC